MFRAQPPQDKTIVNSVTRRLASCGVRAPSRVTVACAGGEVTLSGVIRHESMRQLLLRAARGAGGVRNVIDHLKAIASTGRA